MPLNSAEARPGLIIVIGVAVIALALVVVLLIPLPTVDRSLNAHIPTGVQEQTRSRGQSVVAVSLTTTQSMAGVLEFYRKKLDIRSTLSARGGMMTMSRGRIFGGHYSDAVLPLGRGPGEAIMITHRTSREIVVIGVSRAKDESLTHLAVLLERLPGSDRSRSWPAANPALSLSPPHGIAGGSGAGVGLQVAEFSTGALFEAVARHYAKLLGLMRSDETIPVIKELPSGDFGILRQERENAQSILFTKTTDPGQSIYVFCFKDNASTQTHAGASWVAK